MSDDIIQEQVHVEVDPVIEQEAREMGWVPFLNSVATREMAWCRGIC